jgi:hypothetical protein
MFIPRHFCRVRAKVFWGHVNEDAVMHASETCKACNKLKQIVLKLRHVVKEFLDAVTSVQVASFH